MKSTVRIGSVRAKVHDILSTHVHPAKERGGTCLDIDSGETRRRIAVTFTEQDANHLINTILGHLCRNPERITPFMAQRAAEVARLGNVK